MRVIHCFTLVLLVSPALTLGACDQSPSDRGGSAGLGGGGGSGGDMAAAGYVSEPGGTGGASTIPPYECPDTPPRAGARLLRVPEVLPSDVFGTHGMAVSADGSTMVGRVIRLPEDAQSFKEEYQAYRWSPTEGFTLLETPAGFQSVPFDVSADGSVVVGDVFANGGPGSRGARWTAEGLELLPMLEGGKDGSASAVSADGSIVGGYQSLGDGTRSVAVLWTPTSIQTLQAPSGASSGNSARGAAVHDVDDAADNAIGHRDTTNAVVWSALGAPQDLLVAGAQGTFALALTGDGTAIVGRAEFPGGAEPYRWNRSTLEPEPLGFPQSSREFNGEAWDGDRSGDVVVGSVGIFNGGAAVIWDRRRGPQFLADILTDLDEDLSAWYLKVARSVSADGTIVVGDADCGTWPRAFFARLTPYEAVDAGAVDAAADEP
jgi:uncharacterized membrane protein